MTASWQQIREALRHQRRVTPRSRDDFWTDFQARASLMPHQSVRTRYAWSRLWVPSSVAAVAAALVISVLIIPGPSEAAVTRVKSLTVMATHSGVFIMKPDADAGTVVWISGLEK
jgi:hypothetical protein